MVVVDIIISHDCTVGSTGFSSWMYILTYQCLSTNSSAITLNTTGTMLVLTSLEPSTLYQITITARGPGGDDRSTKGMVFVTLNDGEIHTDTQ